MRDNATPTDRAGVAARLAIGQFQLAENDVTTGPEFPGLRGFRVQTHTLCNITYTHSEPNMFTIFRLTNKSINKLIIYLVGIILFISCIICCCIMLFIANNLVMFDM